MKGREKGRERDRLHTKLQKNAWVTNLTICENNWKAENSFVLVSLISENKVTLW